MIPAHALAEAALDAGTAASDHVVVVDEVAAEHLRWASNTVTANGSVRTRRLTAIALACGRVGTVAVDGPLDAATARAVVRDAEDRARRAAPAADADDLPRATGSGAWADPPAELAPHHLDELGAELAAAFDPAVPSTGYAEQRLTTTYTATSHGLRLRYEQPAGLLGLSSRLGDETAWTGTSVPTLGEARAGDLAESLATRLKATKHHRRLPADRYEVLLTPSCAADLMLHLYEAASGRDAQLGQTAFAWPGGGNRLGERVTDLPLTLHSDPAEPGLSCLPVALARAHGGTGSVFDTGLPLRRTDWISEGVLTNLVFSRHDAREAGARPAPAIGNLALTGEPDAPTLDEMITTTRYGILITSLWYLRDVDPRTLLLTGVTRDGVLLVENGEITAALDDFRFNISPLGLLERVTEAGRTGPALAREWGDDLVRTAMPPLRVAGFPFSSVVERR